MESCFLSLGKNTDWLIYISFEGLTYKNVQKSMKEFHFLYLSLNAMTKNCNGVCNYPSKMYIFEDPLKKPKFFLFDNRIKCM